jgi:hypothetical protein
MALDGNGSIISWGRDSYGQVTDTPGGAGYTAIAAGIFHNMALDGNGSIISWGNDNFNQVTDTPTGDGFTAIAAGGYHNMALDGNGSIISWGRDSYGQVSDKPSGTGFTAIAAGYEHSMALTAPEPPPEDEPCDLDEDAYDVCDTDDLDALYAVFNTNVPPTDVRFNLNFDDVVDGADLNEWLSLAATRNGHGSPYLLGDTDLDRDVDLADYSALATNFDPTGSLGSHGWDHGNSDGDSDVDLADYNVLASNFSPAGYGAAAVPEPSSIVLVLAAILAAAAVGYQRR